MLSYRVYFFFFFFKHKTAYEMRISDWSSDVCSSDLRRARLQPGLQPAVRVHLVRHLPAAAAGQPPRPGDHRRREEVRRTIAVTRLTADRKEFGVPSTKHMSCRPRLATILVAVKRKRGRRDKRGAVR